MSIIIAQIDSGSFPFVLTYYCEMELTAYD